MVTPEGEQKPEPPVDLVRLSAPGEPLSPFLVMMFYAHGIFPWLHNQQARQLWWSPEPRSILILNELHVSRSLRRLIRSGRFRVTADTRFEEVVRLCGITREISWISDETIHVFTTLHELGHAHSVEVWDRDQLVGGLFGVCVGQMFYGCSMFHTVSNASKIALVSLVEKLTEWDFPLIDCQLHNPHLQRMGARLVPRDSFHEIVQLLVRGRRRIGPWTPFFT